MNAVPMRGLRLVHTVPGRTRLRFSELKTHPHRHPHLRQKLASIHGVHHVETNPNTGSVVLYHDRAITRSTAFLTAIAAAFGLAAFTPTDIDEWLELLDDGSANEAADLRTAIEGIASTIDRTVVDLTHGRLDGKMLLPAVLVVLGLRGLLAGETLVAPKWYEFFWFAFSAYVALNTANKPTSQDETVS
ncbi:HMA2 domain-containing protein [Nitrospira sp. Nam74]